MEEEADPFDRQEAEEGDVGERNSNDEGHKDDEAEEVPTKKTTVKRIVRNPQPKLNPDRLSGPKGIPELLRMSKNMKLKGKGHELQDLNLIMNTLKHWGHRLFPKIMSNDFFERVERLGTKKTVQGYVRRVRMGLENVDITSVPKSLDMVASDGEDDVQRGMDDHHRDAPQEDLFENLLDSTVNDVNSESLASPSYTLQTPKPPMVFDEDAKARAERNRQLAIERRLKRLAEKSSLSTENNPTDQSETSLNSSVIQDYSEPTDIHRSGNVQANVPLEKTAETNDTAAMACQGTEKTYGASEPLFDSPMETD
ncbi:TIMELESS-interacting protein-like [Ornithodoros turicata]|uniref:TIMELESS-interacting protein-like n=1 Tax=Ornithodoros turicata TaxID=34597 RepID=UPI00313A40A9